MYANYTQSHTVRPAVKATPCLEMPHLAESTTLIVPSLPKQSVNSTTTPQLQLVANYCHKNRASLTLMTFLNCNDVTQLPCLCFTD